MIGQIVLVEAPSLLGSLEKEALVNNCFPLVCSGFVQEPSSEVYEDTRHHVLSCDHLWLYEEEGRVRAFAAWDEMEIAGAKILYLSGIMVSPDTQGKGVGARIIADAWSKYQSDYLIARTQNPVMYSSLIRSGFQLYPTLQRTTSEIAGVMVRVLAKSFGWDNPEPHNPHLFNGAYGKCLYGVRPVDRDENIERFFCETLDFDRGDAMVVVGQKS